MIIKLIYQSNDLGDSWRKYFSEEKNVKIIKGNIIKESCDAIVSPANSFGFMDGGLDYALSVRFGWGMQNILQDKIQELDEKELLVGKTITIKTNDELIPFLISAPTMRVPMSFNIATSVNAYLAMKAILIAVKNNPQINTIAIPGLCTGCGRMDPDTAAIQMYSAYSEIIKGEQKKFESFGEAQKGQNKLNNKGLIWD